MPDQPAARRPLLPSRDQSTKRPSDRAVLVAVDKEFGTQVPEKSGRTELSGDGSGEALPPIEDDPAIAADKEGNDE